ncbi:MAG: hypothetical protein ABI851_12180 [Saprospiraceae bacterium]
MSARLQDINQAASAGCATKTAGIKKVWLIENTDITAVTVTEVATKAEISAITLSGANKAWELTFTQDQTAFLNQTQANATDPVDNNLFFSYDGISPEKIDLLNGVKNGCAFSAFVQLASGTIIFIGRDYDYTANTNEEMTKPLQLKGQVNSGLGNNDSEKVVFEFVGQSKIFQLTTTLTAAALNAL